MIVVMEKGHSEIFLSGSILARPAINQVHTSRPLAGPIQSSAEFRDRYKLTIDRSDESQP